MSVKSRNGEPLGSPFCISGQCLLAAVLNPISSEEQLDDLHTHVHFCLGQMAPWALEQVTGRFWGLIEHRNSPRVVYLNGNSNDGEVNVIMKSLEPADPRQAVLKQERQLKKHKLGAEEQARLDILSEHIRETVRGPFRPCALYTPGLSDVRVIRKDCSYTAKRVSSWSDVLLDNHCPWWKPWGRYIGFQVYCPSIFGFLRDKPVTIPVKHLLDRVLVEDPYAFGKYKRLYYWLARGLRVRIYKEEPKQ